MAYAPREQLELEMPEAASWLKSKLALKLAELAGKHGQHCRKVFDLLFFFDWRNLNYVNSNLKQAEEGMRKCLVAGFESLVRSGGEDKDAKDSDSSGER